MSTENSRDSSDPGKAGRGENRVAAEKNRLRSQLKTYREGLGQALRARASRLIQNHLFSLPEFSLAKGVHCFLSFPEEPDTAPIFQACAAAGKRTYVPYLDPLHGRLECALWKSGDPLAEGRFSLLEPIEERKISANLEEIDLMVIPGLGFDRSGGRLGFGKGYYDAFLTRLLSLKKQPRPHLTALAFSGQIVSQIPQQPWDVRMDSIVTELQILKIDARA